MKEEGFFCQVYQLVAQIPLGKVATYGQIALLAGRPRAARMVGWAMASAPPEKKLPCHRVVAGTGRLAPGDIFGGEGIQRQLLEEEGVAFLPDGRIHMKVSLWRP